MDETIAAVFADVGIADAAEFTPAGGGAAIPCTVYVDRDVQAWGDEEVEVSVPRTMITLFLAEVTPAHGAIVAIGDESFELDEEERRDESRAVWSVA